HHDIDPNLWSDGSVGLKVEGAVEHVAQRESARVHDCDGDRHRKAEPTAQTREDRQIDAEGEAVDQAEAKKYRRNDRAEPERKPNDDRLTQLMESVDRPRSAGTQFGSHPGTVPRAGIRRG